MDSSLCNCMATRHRFLTSCSSCGWIACSQNALKVCGACEKPLLLPMTATDAVSAGFDEATVKAYMQKDKLMQFDKENAQRTQVHDAQADYYESGTWLTEEEKKAIATKEQLKREAANSTRNKKFNICLYNTKGNLVKVHDLEQEECTNVVSCTLVSGDYPDSLLDYDKPEWMDDDVKNDKTQGTESQDDFENQTVTLSYENTALQLNRGKAGDIYRSMKKRYYFV